MTLDAQYKKVVANQRSSRRAGPSDWSRTSGLVVPNHALYQLSYTRILLPDSRKKTPPDSFFIIQDCAGKCKKKDRRERGTCVSGNFVVCLH